MRSLFAAISLFCVALAGQGVRAQNSELCDGLLDELLIAVDRGNAAVERVDNDSATEIFFWVEEAAEALELSCSEFLPEDVRAWLADTRLSAMVQVRQWDLAIDEADACAERYGGQGYCWLRGAQAMQALDRPAGVRRFLDGFEANRSDNLPSAFEDMSIELERWLNLRGDTPESVTSALGGSHQFLLQRLLDAGGFDPGIPDGMIGPQTMEALARFYQDIDGAAPQEPLTILTFSKVLFDFEPLLQGEPSVVAALEPARAEIEPFFEAPHAVRVGSGLLIDGDGHVLTDFGLIKNCGRIEVQADLPRHELVPSAARVIVTDGELGFAVLSSGLKTGYWARFEPLEEDILLGLEPASDTTVVEDMGDFSQAGLMIAGYPLYGPLRHNFVARYAGASLEHLEADLDLEWLGAPVTNERGHLVAVVTTGSETTLSGLVELQRSGMIAEALLGDALEISQGRADDPVLSPSDQARLQQLMAVNVACYAG